MRRRLLIALGACAVVITFWLGKTWYQQIRLSYWLAVYSDNEEAEAGSPEGQKAAKGARVVRQIGINGLPLALKWTANPRHYSEALGYFEILGPAAAPAIPALTRMVNDSEQEVVRGAIYPLAYIGREGLPALVAALGNPNNPDRSTIADAIRIMAIDGVDTSAAVPALLGCLKDTNTWVAMSAAEALIWAARQEPSPAIPMLVICLKDSRPELRDSAAEALGCFRGKARAAVPELQSLLTDKDPRVRWQASNSLTKIAPEVLTNGIAGDHE